MKRIIWETITGFISIKKYPKLPCPYCNSESLVIDKSSLTYKTVACKKTKSLIDNDVSRKAKVVSDAFEKDVFLGVLFGIGALAITSEKTPAKFVTFFKCVNCENEVPATGTAQLVSKESAAGFDSDNLIKVEYFSPPIPIFQLPKLVPESIVDEVLQSFNHYHADINSSGNKLRRSIEKLCKHLGFNEKSLHASICSMEKEFPSEAKLLYSLKLVGNEATHSDNVCEEDLLDAFEVLSFVLEIFERIAEEKKIQSKADKLLERFSKKI